MYDNVVEIDPTTRRSPISAEYVLRLQADQRNGRGPWAVVSLPAGTHVGRQLDAWVRALRRARHRVSAERRQHRLRRVRRRARQERERRGRVDASQHGPFDAPVLRHLCRSQRRHDRHRRPSGQRLRAKADDRHVLAQLPDGRRHDVRHEPRRSDDGQPFHAELVAVLRRPVQDEPRGTPRCSRSSRGPIAWARRRAASRRLSSRLSPTIRSAPRTVYAGTNRSTSSTTGGAPGELARDQR